MDNDIIEEIASLAKILSSHRGKTPRELCVRIAHVYKKFVEDEQKNYPEKSLSAIQRSFSFRFGKNEPWASSYGKFCALLPEVRSLIVSQEEKLLISFLDAVTLGRLSEENQRIFLAYHARCDKGRDIGACVRGFFRTRAGQKSLNPTPVVKEDFQPAPKEETSLRWVTEPPKEDASLPSPPSDWKAFMAEKIKTPLEWPGGVTIHRAVKGRY